MTEDSPSPRPQRPDASPTPSPTPSPPQALHPGRHAGRPPRTADQPLNVPITWPRRTSRAATSSTAATATRPGRRSRRRSAPSRAAGAWPSPPGWPRSPRCSTWSATAPRSSRRCTPTPAPLLQLADLEARGRITASLVDITDTAAVVAACEDAALVWFESPTNPALELADIEAISAAAHEAGAYVVVDNTFATPLLQTPLALGADIVVHSATKYLAGHSDVLLGAIATTDDQLYAVLKGRRDLLGSMPGHARGLARPARPAHPAPARRAGAGQRPGAGPRGSREHPALAEVRYPGFGGIVSIVLAQGAMAADLLTRKTRLWVHATSLGGVESTFERRRRWKAEPATIPDGLVRLSRRHRGRRRPVGRPAPGARRPGRLSGRSAGRRPSSRGAARLSPSPPWSPGR